MSENNAHWSPKKTLKIDNDRRGKQRRGRLESRCEELPEVSFNDKDSRIVGLSLRCEISMSQIHIYLKPYVETSSNVCRDVKLRPQRRVSTIRNWEFRHLHLASVEVTPIVRGWLVQRHPCTTFVTREQSLGNKGVFDAFKRERVPGLRGRSQFTQGGPFCQCPRASFPSSSLCSRPKNQWLVPPLAT